MPVDQVRISGGTINIRNKGIDVGVGAVGTINSNPNSLATYYGGTTHGGWQIFMRLMPSKSH